MAEELETKPDVGEETKPEVTEGAKPEGRTDVTQEPPQAEETPSQVTQEQYEAAVKGMNEAQRQAAEAQRLAQESHQQATHYRTIAQAAAGVVQQQQDPLAAAEAEFQRISEEDPFNAAAIAQAQRKVFSAELAQLQEKNVSEMRNLYTVQSQLPSARQVLGVGPEVSDQEVMERLHRVSQSATADQLAQLARIQDGSYDDFRETQRKAREEKAAQAAALQSIGEPGRRHVPGRGAETKFIDFADWSSLNEAAKQRHRDAADYTLEIVNAPKHFNPEKD